LTGTPTEYKPGHWFNSAKFLDIEYQTYGWVWAEAKENEEHFTGNTLQEKTIVHLTKSAFLGINTFESACATNSLTQF
jgi:hypothetical protein